MRCVNVIGFVIFFSACKIGPQPREGVITISSISVYKYFSEGGYTSLGAFTHFDRLAKENIATISNSNEDRLRLEKILNNVVPRKHFQTKLGIRLLFCEAFFGNSTAHRLVISNPGMVYNMFGKAKEEQVFVIDLTAWIDYKITDHEDLKWLSDFRDRMKHH